MYPAVVIKNDRIASIERRHPWIFSRGVISAEGCSDGDIVEVQSKKGDYLATGYYRDGSIMVRIISFEQREINQAFWNEKIENAHALRNRIGLPSPDTDAYRLIHGEGDGLPGLIIDIYGTAAVIQCHSIGMHRMLSMIQTAIQQIYGSDIETIYDKSYATLPRDYAQEHAGDQLLVGDTDVVQVRENGHAFKIDLVNSQKTGFFLDQRDNRQLLGEMAQGRSVLNLYCYTGGFSIYALNQGANEVCSIDSSKTAIATLEENVKLNGDYPHHTSLTEDVNRYLKSIPSDQYDIIVVDPPAFAKSIRKKHNALQAYKRVNRAAIEKVKTKGFIFTFSCSQVIDMQLFYGAITAAAIEAGRPCRVLHHLSQGADHPVSIFHPEGKYLKGLVLAID